MIRSLTLHGKLNEAEGDAPALPSEDSERGATSWR